MSSPTPFVTPHWPPKFPRAGPVLWASFGRRGNGALGTKGQAEVRRPTARLRWPHIEFGRFSVGTPARSKDLQQGALPQAARRDLGLDGEDHEPPEWDPGLPYFLQAGFDRQR